MRFARLVPVLLAGATAAVTIPAYADGTGYAGLTCNLATLAGGPLLWEMQDGVLTFGPWFAGDYVDDPTPGGTHLEGASADWECWVQINSATPGTNVVVTCWTNAGNGCAVAYVAAPSDNVYVCTRVTMRHDSQTEVYQEDDDPDTAGVQCALAITAYSGDQVVVTKPARLVSVVG